MRLTRKLAIALTLAIVVVLGTNSLVRVAREVRMFDENSRADNELLGRAVAGAAALTWQRVGEAEALDLVEDANQRESHVQIRWVWLDAPAGHPHAPELPRSSITRALQRETLALKMRAAEHTAEALYTYVPVTIPGSRRAAVELRESLAAEQAYLHRTILQAVIATAIMLGLSAMITFGLGALLVGRPVRRLVEQAQRIGAGDLASRIDLTQTDEIGDLAREMNAMSERLLEARQRIEAATEAKVAAVEQLRHADRLTTVGKLASGIAHEVGTPLNVIGGHAQLVVEEHPAGTTAHGSALVIGEQVRRVAAIIRQLLDFARPRAIRRVQQNITPIVTQAAAMLDPLAQKRSVQLEVIAPAQPVSGLVDAGQLQQVVTNLVMNAIQATPEGGMVSVDVEHTRSSPPPPSAQDAIDCVRVSVADPGSGIDPDALPNIFEPFYTTKAPGEGTGLGLSVVYGIVKEHGGWIAVESSIGRGSKFSVYLPLEHAS